MVLSRIHTGRLTIVTPSGMRLSHGSGIARRASDPAPLADLRRLLFQGDIAAAEAFIDGDWDSPDLPALIELAGRNMPTLSETFDANWLQRLRNRIRHRLNANTKRGSQRNIRHHYDLGNEFYRTWLDRGMSYSSAIFSGPDQTLEEAQTAKQQRVIELLETTSRPAGAGDRLRLGRPGGAIGATVGVSCDGRDVVSRTTGIRPATGQLKLARHADLRLQDYRDVRGVFDRVVSIEMMEAVGEAYWPSYFATLRDRLKPGGLAVIQAITIAEDKFEGYRRCTDFIQHYIFPGGMLPTITEIKPPDRKGRAEASDQWRRSAAATPEPWKNGASGFTRRGRRFSAWASTRGFAGCGTIIWPIVRAGFAPERSMSDFTCWRSPHDRSPVGADWRGCVAAPAGAGCAANPAG